MIREVDARGLACPKPVIMAREALGAGDEPFVVIVDNEAARDNVYRYAATSGCGVDVTEEEGFFRLRVTPSSSGQASAAVDPGRSGLVLVITSEVLGGGDHELGAALMKMFLYTCTEIGNPPSAAVFMNSGVMLVTENEETARHVAALEEAGTEVLVCGTCLDRYGLTDELKAGTVSNMYEIVTLIVGADRLLSL